MKKEIINIVYKISDRYYGGNFKFHLQDIASETHLNLLEAGINPFEVDFFVLWKAVSKAFYKTISDYGFSKKLNKSESELCNIFYSIESMTDSMFKDLEMIEKIYSAGNYKSVIKYFNLNLDKQSEKKLRKFLSICFPKYKRKSFQR